MIEIISNGLKTQVFIDGAEVKGITNVSFEATLHQVPKLNLTLLSVPNNEEEMKKARTKDNSDDVVFNDTQLEDAL